MSRNWLIIGLIIAVLILMGVIGIFIQIAEVFLYILVGLIVVALIAGFVFGRKV